MADSKHVPVREILDKLFPAAFLMTLDAGAAQRVRTISPVDFLWIVVLGFGVGPPDCGGPSGRPRE